jgi:hypothetical protein
VIHAAGKRFTVFNSRQSYARSADAVEAKMGLLIHRGVKTAEGRTATAGGLVFLTGTNDQRFRACPKRIYKSTHKQAGCLLDDGVRPFDHSDASVTEQQPEDDHQQQNSANSAAYRRTAVIVPTSAAE